MVHKVLCFSGIQVTTLQILNSVGYFVRALFTEELAIPLEHITGYSLCLSIHCA